MSPAPGSIALIDPLTLLGHEVLQRMQGLPQLGAGLLLLHTRLEEEHEIAEIGDSPRLVPPLMEEGDLEGCAAVVVASDTPSERLSRLLPFLDRNPDLPVVDLSRLELLWEKTVPLAAPAPRRPAPPAVRVAHPCLVATHHIVQALRDLGPTAITLTALEPASIHGKAGVQGLARQAAARLRGEPPGDLVGGETLAFSLVALPADELMEEASLILQGLQVTVGRGAGGWFHGHAVLLGISFTEPVEESDLLERWMAAEPIAMEENRLRLDAVTDREAVLVGTPCLSADGRTVAVTAMVDGLVVGGALTAVELLMSLL